MSAQAGELLSCGTDPVALAEQAAGGPPAAVPGHVEGCEHCQAVLRRLAAVDLELAAVAVAPVTVPRGLRARVVGRVRRQGDALVLRDGRLGRDTAQPSAVAAAVRHAVRAVDGVAEASAVVRGKPELRVEVHLVAAMGRPLPALAAAVRAAARTELERSFGLDVGTVDVNVDDVV